MKSKASASKRWIHLIIGTVIMLALGLIYAWSVFAKPLEAEFGWSRSDTSLTFTLSIIFFVIGLIVTGFLVKKIAPQWLLVGAGLFLAIGFYGCSTIKSIEGLYLFYGVLVGLGVGVANNALVSSVVAWFPEKRGIASGILMMGFGLGGLLLTSTTEALIRSLGWRQVFMWFALVFGVVVASGFFVARFPSEKDLEGLVTTTKSKVAAGKDYSLRQVLAKSSYWLYIVWFALVMAGGLLIIGHASPFAEEMGTTTIRAAQFAGILSLSNGVGRILTGWTADKFGLRISMFCMSTYLVIASAMLLLSLYFTSFPLLLIGFIFTGLSYGGGPTTSSVYASRYYGSKHFAMNYAALSAGMIISSLIGPFLAGKLRVSTGGYGISCSIMLVFAVVALVTLRFIKKPEEV